MSDETKPIPSESSPQEEKPAINQTPSASPAAKPKSNVAVIIIIIVVAVLILGVGSYFGWKYYGKKLVEKWTGKTTQTGTTTSSGKISIKSVIDLLTYPGSKITDQKQETDSVYKAELTSSSADGVETIKNYYLDLVKKNSWTITRQGSADDNNFYMTIVSKDFTDEFEETKYAIDDYTTIWHKLSGDNLAADGIAISATGGTSTTTTPTTTGATGTTGATTSSAYIIADSNTRVISESELTSLTPWQLKIARNEIYARHGRPFVHKDLQCYFAKQSWYKSDPNFTETSLTYTENKNVATILAYEQKTASPLLQVDSGCQQ